MSSPIRKKITPGSGLAALGVAFFLGGCAVQPVNPAAPFYPYIGGPETALIQRFGVPERIYTEGKTTFFTYVFTHTKIERGPPVLMPPPVFSYGFYRLAYFAPGQAVAVPVSCTATLTIVNRIVQDVSVYGSCGG